MPIPWQTIRKELQNNIIVILHATNKIVSPKFMLTLGLGRDVWPEVTWGGVQRRQNLKGTYDDGNGQKRNKVRLAQTTTLHVHHTFLYISLPSSDVIWPIKSTWEWKRQGDKFKNLSLELERGPRARQFQKKTSLNLTSLLSGNCFTWYKAENVWKVQSRFLSDVPIGVSVVGSWDLYKYQGLPYLWRLPRDTSPS